MQKRGLIVLVLAVIVLIASSLACVCPLSVPGLGQGVRGSGDVVEEMREVSGFTGVTLATIGNLYIEQGDEEGLRIEAEDNLLPYFEIEVDGGMLKIGTKPGVNLRPTVPVNFYLMVRGLDAILLAGSGEIEAPGLEAGDLEATVSGSGEVNMPDLEADKLTVVIAGSGDLSLSGEVDEQEITISGSGEVKARDLACTEAVVRITGSGSATVRVSDHLDVTISGSGSVRYIGSPTVETTVTGSGSVRQTGD
jgi:hypothetical protein